MYKLLNGVKVLMTQEEEKAFLDLTKKKEKPLEELNQEKIAEYQKYLADTDYVVIKISEAMVSGNQQLIDELKNKYADVLTNRDNKRKQINELEKEIKKEKEESKKQEGIIEQTQEKDIVSIEEVDKIPENIDSDRVKVVDSVEIISDQTEEQGKVMETMDINKKNKLEKKTL